MTPGQQKLFDARWMKTNILSGHGPLCAMYEAHGDGRFRSEGDSPAFMHSIVTGLRSMESPDWGGWGGRYVKVHENIWLDPVLDPDYQYPKGRYYSSNGGRHHVRKRNYPTQTIFDYCKPIWRWSRAFQNDWAARAGSSRPRGRAGRRKTSGGCDETAQPQRASAF